MITKNFFQFLRDLAKNNNKDWFDVNRMRYESEVKKPFEQFVVTLGNELGKFDGEIQGDFKKNIFRINKDIRFSKDKSPYKTHLGIWLSTGAKNVESAGYYLQIDAENPFVGGGMYCPQPEQIQKIRQI